MGNPPANPANPANPAANPANPLNIPQPPAIVGVLQRGVLQLPARNAQITRAMVGHYLDHAEVAHYHICVTFRKQGNATVDEAERAWHIYNLVDNFFADSHGDWRRVEDATRTYFNCTRVTLTHCEELKRRLTAKHLEYVFPQYTSLFLVQSVTFKLTKDN